MKKSLQELQKIKGVGEILAKRFIKAGYDSFDRVAAAGAEGLKTIQGINQQAIPVIIQQAAALAAEISAERAKKIAELKSAAAELRKQVDGIGETFRTRAGEELQGSIGKRIEAELHKMAAALEKAEQKLEKRVKRSGKSLVKAGKRLSGITAETEAAALGSTLKKARKSLKRIYD
jgi:recombinational DNA repair ATPase RecF